MQNWIIAGVVLVIVVISALRIRKHFSGGGCCGSGSNTIRDRKKLENPAIGEEICRVSGMTCINCEIRVENALNRFDGVVARVNWKKGTALLTYDREPDWEKMAQALEKLGYSVEKTEK